MPRRFVAERILAVLCSGPLQIFSIDLTQHSRSAKNEIFVLTQRNVTDGECVMSVF